MKIDQSKNIFAVEIVSIIPPRIPSVPFGATADEYIQRLILTVPASQM
jgi:hypothetical protein